MLIVNADDFGRSRPETDVVIECYSAKKITSTTAMVYMEDSARAAAVAKGCGLDVGLHLNLSESLTAKRVNDRVRDSHERLVRFLTSSKYALLVYNPFLRRQFRVAIEAQLHEFVRLYGRQPSHIDGHQHQHLCSNVLLDGLLPPGFRVRRSFSFWRGEKGAVNRIYRRLIDRALARNHPVADYFFSLRQCLDHDRLSRVFRLAETETVELMTHPVHRAEYEYLMGDEWAAAVRHLSLGTYAKVG